MAVYQLQPVTASLVLLDTPVGYTPPRGPNLQLTLSYHQRDPWQPQTFAFSNVGPKWSFDWIRFVKEEPADPLGITPAHVWAAQRAGGREVYVNPDAQGVFGAHWASRAVLVRVSTSPLRYERRIPDGTVEVYAASDGAPAGQRRIFLTQLIDPRGQSVSLTWDAQSRLVAVTDAIGQVTTISYDLSTDLLKITKITDPFGRFATFTYNSAGQLASITDVIGMSSAFAYGPNDFVNALTTPYGRTSFRHEPNAGNTANLRFIEATDPLGGTEHVEFQWETPSLAATAPSSDVPTGFAPWNTNLDHYNTFYWDKRAWMLGAGDLSKATVTHWMVGPEWPGWQKYSYVPHSIKKPLESRVWYAYSGQVSGQEDTLNDSAQPSRVGRIVENGSSQISETTYNPQGAVLTRSDPAGRRKSFTYANNGIDLLEVRQTTGGMNDLLATYGAYNTQHLPQSITDAAGQILTIGYNAAGQVQTLTNAKNQTTTIAYDSDGRMQSVTYPAAGATTTYSYDTYGRLRTVTDLDAYVVTIDYDSFDRAVRTTYPDGSYEESTYDRLDVVMRRDRAGRITRYYYDALRRLIATRDPLGRTISQEWCACGSIDALVDPKGNRTQWQRDLEGRVTEEVRADGITTTTYAYGTSGRLLTVTDPKGQVTSYTYALDNALVSTAYTNSAIETPTVSFTYDAQYGRTTTMTDGTGLTTYTYKPVGTLGATQVATVDGPLTDDTVTYAYDELGRATTTSLNGVDDTQTFDSLGRITNEVSALGSFVYGYDGVSARIASVSYPNQQTSTYTYLNNAGDRRLQTIHHKYPSGATLSRFDYTYDAAANINTWRQQTDAAAIIWQYSYDSADQLISATKQTTDAVPTTLSRYNYAYDRAANRTAEQVDDQLTSSSYDALNRLTSQHPSGAMVVEGTVNEPATVTVQDKIARVASGGRFDATAPVSAGTTTLTIVATDSSGNASTKQYDVDSLGAARTFTYDANGNMLSDGSHIYGWDAQNRLVSVSVGLFRRELSYDGMSRLSRVRELDDDVIVGDDVFIWCGMDMCQKRSSIPNVEMTIYASGGRISNGTASFVAYDHLASARRVTDSNGSPVTTLDYDPFGRVSIAGQPMANQDRAFGAMVSTGPDDTLGQAVYRNYSADLGRWISQDPVGLGGGDNLYRYLENNPIAGADPLGLMAKIRCEIVRGQGYFKDVFLKFANARHCYLEVECLGRYHDTLEIWGPGPEDPDHGRPHRLAYDPKRSRDNDTVWRPVQGGCACSTNPCDFEDQLIDSYNNEKTRLPKYNGLGPNSNTFIRHVIEGACGDPKFPGGAYGASK